MDEQVQVVPTLLKPLNVIVSEANEIFNNQIRNYIENHNLQANNQYGYFSFNFAPQLTIEEPITGHTMRAGWEVRRTINLSDDETLNNLVKELWEIFEQKENNNVKDGYPWIIQNFQGFKITFSPTC